MSTVNLQPSQRYWPEFTVQELLSETWGVPQADTKKKTPDGAENRSSSQTGWYDNEPMSRILPDGLLADKWIKASEYVSKIKESTDHTEMTMYFQPTQSQTDLQQEQKLLENNDYDFLSKNENLFKNSSTMKRIADEISLLYLHKNSLTVGKTEKLVNADVEESVDESGNEVLSYKPSEPWMPYSCIFSEVPAGISATPAKGAKGGSAPGSSPEELDRILKENTPKINQYGKYVVRLFFMGKWRRIFVDDYIPIDAEGNSLLPITNISTKEKSDIVVELWPILLSKALLKIHSLTDENIDGIPMFHPIENLTGHSPKIIQEDFWNSLIEEQVVPEWILDDDNQERKPKSNLVLAYQNDSSFLLTQTRKCPLVEPEPNVEIPSWKLIRPTPEIQDLIKKQNAPPFEHKWFEFAGSCLDQKEPRFQPSSNELSTTEFELSRQLSSATSSNRADSKNKKIRKNSSKVKKDKNLERCASNLSANSNRSLPVIPVTSGISLNSRKKWIDSKNIDNLQWVAVYQDLSSTETINQEFSSHTQDTLELYMVYDSQDFADQPFVNLKMNLSVLAKNIKEDSENSENIEAEFSIKELFGLFNENILHVGACSGSTGHHLPLSNSKRHLLKFTMFGASHGYSLRLALDVPKSHHNSVQFYISTNFEQISEKFLNSRPYKFSKAAEEVYSQFVESGEINEDVADDLDIKLAKKLVENKSVENNLSDETIDKEDENQVDFGKVVSDFEEKYGENHTVEFLKRTIHRIEGSENWTDGNEMYSYQVNGRYDQAQTEASTGWNLAYRDIFYASEKNSGLVSWRLCISDYSRDLSMQQSIHFLIIDNDTCTVKNRVRKVFRDAENFDIITKPGKLKKNNFGYLVLVYAENNSNSQISNDCAFNWKIEIISDEDKPLIQSRELVLADKNSVESGGTGLFHAYDEHKDLMPTEGNVISRIALNVSPNNVNSVKPFLVSLRATVSNPDAWIRLILLERQTLDSGNVEESVVLETRGQGKVLIPSKWLNPVFNPAARSSRLGSSQTDRSNLNESNTSLRESVSKSRMRSPSPKTGGTRKKSSKTKVREDSAKSKASVEQIRENPTTSTLSVTKTPSFEESSSKGIRERSYFVELIFENWSFSENQSRYIEFLEKQALQDNKVFGEKGELVRSGSGKKKLKNQASKKVIETVEIDESEKPKWSCSFVMDKELGQEIEVKIDNSLQEWLKREKLSWACAEEKNEENEASEGARSERAYKARQDWLEFRETEEAMSIPDIERVGESENVELLSKWQIEELTKSITEKCKLWREERDKLLEKREQFKVDNTNKLARMKILDEMFGSEVKS